MDSIISISFFNDIMPEEVKSLSYIQKRKWLFDSGLIGRDSSPMALGYRIPTQGLSSVSALKFVDVLDDTSGDTIILPSEFTRLTGADFDIDKLFLARYSLY